MEKRQPIQERTIQFGLRVIKMVQTLPKNPAGYSISNQVIRSGTSIGANISEAQDAASRLDFARGVNIVLKEARETEYWLRMITKSELISRDKMAFLLEEILKIVKILRSSLKKLRSQ